MLRFDGRQRYETVARILRELFPDSPQTVLDVGGGTGEGLDLPTGWTRISVDVRIAPCADFVCGSADRLPFIDHSFHIATCLDTLEHIPLTRRRETLLELSRVAERAVILTAPFERADICAAEKTVADLHTQVTGKPHPWLTEHLANPLPNLEETCDPFLSMGWQVITQPCGYLPLWLMFMLVDQVLETLEEGIEIAEQLDRLYQDQIYPNDLCEPAYRTIVIATQEHARPPTFPSSVDPTQLAGGMCQALSFLTPSLAARWADKVEEDSRSPETLRRYTQRLEQALETWEVAYGEALALAEQGHRRMAELERRRSFRLYQWIMRFLGRSI